MTVATVTLKCGTPVKLGRVRPTTFIEAGNFRIAVLPDGRKKVTAKLGAHYDASKAAALPPASVDWTTKAMESIKRVYLNDQYGDCVIASKYHSVGVYTGNETGTTVLGTDNEVLSAYHSICGAGDNGCVITDVLDVWKSRGLTFNGQVHKIDNYVSIDWTNKLEVMVALDIFGGLTLGVNLPNAWTCKDCTWDVTNTGIVGGHDVPAFGYNDKGVIIATWGGLCTITWAAFTQKKWVEEAYVQLSPDWYSKGNLAPNGINATTLAADLVQLGNGVIPDVGPTPPPPPPPPPPSNTFTLNVPQQPVFIGPFSVGHVPAYSVTGTMGSTAAAKGMGIPITLPAWVVTALRVICAGTVLVPAPWQVIMSVLCALLPAKVEDGTTEDKDVTVVLPPWLPPLLTFLCSEIDLIPNAAVKEIASFLCAILTAPKAKSPCGCK